MDAELSVHDWIAANVPNSGARRSCGVGRCGSCVAMLTYTSGGKHVSRSFNTCLRPVLSCNGMAITTGTGIGSTAKPHAVQKALSDYSGTQCGFCSVGMVMNLYSRLAQQGSTPLSESELDQMVDSNYCRCTGYRPILETYKSFAGKTVATDVPSVPVTSSNVVGVDDTNVPWTQVSTESELVSALTTLKAQGVKDYFLVGGYTSKGLWPERSPAALVSIGGVASLAQTSVGTGGVHIGAGTTITDTLALLESVVKSQPATATAAITEFIKHGKLSPGGNIRNMGTIGGNVMIAYEHKDTTPFPTEWPLLFESVNADVTYVQGGQTKVVKIGDLYSQDLSYAYLKSFYIPFSKAGDVYRTYRTAQRHIYSEAFAAAVMGANVQNNVIQSATLLLNNVSKVPQRLTAIEAQMVGMNVTDETKFQALANALYQAVTPSGAHGDAEFRRSLCVAYFYKFFLSLQPSLPDRLKTGAEPWLQKGMTSGKQTFDEDSSVAPLNIPLPKVDGLKQTTGEAEYIQNISLAANTLHAAPLLATKIGAFTLDASKILAKVAGYRGLVLAKDVPDNSSNLIADGSSLYIGQPLALVLGTTPAAAVKASRLIEVAYTGAKTTVIRTIAEARAAGSFWPDKDSYKLQKGDASGQFSASDYTVSDKWGMRPQYHFHMETQSAYSIPSNDGPLVVHSATQMPTFVAATVRQTLGGLSESKVVVKNRRCGGGFGGKLANSMVPASLCAVAANARKVPISLVYEQGVNMLSLGLRPEWECESKIGFNKDGKINVVQMRPFVSSGTTPACGGHISTLLGAFDNCYNIAAWDIVGRDCKTDLPSNTSMRAPGWLPGIFFMERVITTVAQTLGVDPYVVREANFYKKNDVTPYGLTLKGWDIDTLWAKVKSTAGYQARLQGVATYNANNRWTKKGLTLLASKFTVGYSGTAAENASAMDVHIKVNKDGTVALMCGGTEMGQGLTTKVVQTVAYQLGVAVDDVMIVEQDTSVIGITGADDVTGGSVGSELTCWSAKNACAKVNTALAPVRKLLPSGTWKEVVAKAYDLGIGLTFLTKDEGITGGFDADGHVYCTYGVVAVEATLDVLTGQVDFSRADILYDLGRSVNQIVDIGQIEGAFVMGLGLTMTESIDYSQDGNMNWSDYVIPTPWEIPTEFNVSLANQIVNPYTAGGGKAIGEPPLTMTYAAVEAVELAFKAAAKESGASPSTYRSVQSPLTIQDRQKMAAVQISQMTLSQ
eukprot:TRINITY_DN4919_c2_g1_i1.p2 TRINITY_DN4919_c2_g1~~TRINITY_DN4919_c2_g1_i1.p2  ORF type:complete len:1271 (+),score=571.16 TRINITY_DN4919_c2_g1_i1:109-3813(+)